MIVQGHNTRLAVAALAAVMFCGMGALRADDKVVAVDPGKVSATVTNMDPAHEKARKEAEAAARKEADRLRKEAERAKRDEEVNAWWANLKPDERHNLMRQQLAFGEMPPEMAKSIRTSIDTFLKMSPEERQVFKDNYARWEQMSIKDRQEARDEFRKKKKEFEDQWKKDYPGTPVPPFPLPKGFKYPPKPAETVAKEKK